MDLTNTVIEGTDEKFLKGMSRRASKVLELCLSKGTRTIDKLELLTEWRNKRRKIQTFEKGWTELISAGFIGIDDAVVEGETVTFEYAVRNPQERIDYLKNPPSKIEKYDSGELNIV